MSQRINVRLADSRRGSSAFVAIIAVLLLIGAGVGGWWYYVTYMQGKGDPIKKTTAADVVKTTVAELEESLGNIVKEPAKADEEIASIQKLADEGIPDLSKQVAGAPVDVKASIVTMLATKLKDLQPLIDKAYLVPGVKDKLEPLITKIMAGLKTMGT